MAKTLPDYKLVYPILKLSLNKESRFAALREKAVATPLDTIPNNQSHLISRPLLRLGP